MWIIPLFLCVSIILPNNAQESTNFQTQTATETSYTNSDVNGASTRSPGITLKILSGRNENVDRRVAQNAETHLYYSDDWKRIFVPIDGDRYANENVRLMRHHSQPLYLRRPDSEQNNTIPSKLAEINEFFDVQAPVLNFQGNLTSDSISDDQAYIETQPNENIPVTAESYHPFKFLRIPQNFR